MTTPPKPPHNQRAARRLDRAKALELAKKGLSPSDIARHQGVNKATVWRFLQQSEPERQAVEAFKAGRADAFAKLQGKALGAQEKILDNLMEEGYLESLAPHQKSGLLMSLNTVLGTAYDKERLERGKSTQNHSMIHKMMAEALEAIHKPETASQDPEPDAGSDE